MKTYRFVCIPPEWDNEAVAVRVFKGRGATSWTAWQQMCRTYLIPELKKASTAPEYRRSYRDALEVLDDWLVVAVFEGDPADCFGEFENRLRSAKEARDAKNKN